LQRRSGIEEMRQRLQDRFGGELVGAVAACGEVRHG
jgi:hypothetical protein